MARAIFTFMKGDVAVDPTAERAAAGMEAVDVEGGEFEVIYDDAGVIYEAIIDGRRVRLMPTDRRDREDLVGRLIRLGNRAGLDLPERADDVPLVAARQLAARAWERRWPKHPRWLSARIHGSAPHPY